MSVIPAKAGIYLKQTHYIFPNLKLRNDQAKLST